MIITCYWARIVDTWLTSSLTEKKLNLFSGQKQTDFFFFWRNHNFDLLRFSHYLWTHVNHYLRILLMGALILLCLEFPKPYWNLILIFLFSHIGFWKLLLTGKICQHLSVLWNFPSYVNRNATSKQYHM